MLDHKKTKRIENIESMIHDYIDGRMLPEIRADFESLLQEDQALSQRVSAYKEQKEIIRMAYEDVLQEKIPQRLLDTVHGHMQRHDGQGYRRKNSFYRRSMPVLRVASILGVCLLSAWLGWQGQSHWTENRNIAQQAQVTTQSAPQNNSIIAAPVTPPASAVIADTIQPRVETAVVKQAEPTTMPPQIESDLSRQLERFLDHRDEQEQIVPSVQSIEDQLIDF